MFGTAMAGIGTLFGPATNVRRLVETATGWVGLVVVAVYSFLIAFVLPLPSEVVLAASLDLGVVRWIELALIVVVSSVAKAAGSLVAFRVGQGAKEAGPVLRAFERLGLDVRERSQRQTVRLAKRHGYAGLALALSVPFFPIPSRSTPSPSWARTTTSSRRPRSPGAPVGCSSRWSWFAERC